MKTCEFRGGPTGERIACAACQQELLVFGCQHPKHVGPCVEWYPSDPPAANHQECAKCPDFTPAEKVYVTADGNGLGDLCILMQIAAANQGSVKLVSTREDYQKLIVAFGLLPEEPKLNRPVISYNDLFKVEQSLLQANHQFSRIEFYASQLTRSAHHFTPTLKLLAPAIESDDILIFWQTRFALRSIDQNVWRELAQRFAIEGRKVCFVGDADYPEDRKLPRASYRKCASLVEVAQLIAGSKGVYSGDTGPGHLAGMLGVPSVVFAGYTNGNGFWHYPKATLYLPPDTFDCAGCMSGSKYKGCSTCIAAANLDPWTAPLPGDLRKRVHSIEPSVVKIGDMAAPGGHDGFELPKAMHHMAAECAWYYVPPMPLDPDEAIVDVGAFWGTWAVEMARRYPNNKLFCIEPNRKNHPVLLQNVPSAARYHVAVWQQPLGEMALVGDGQGAQLQLRTDQAKQNWVETVNLEQLFGILGVQRIGILKLDCEGAEEDLLTHGEMEWFDRCRMICGEIHFWLPKFMQLRRTKFREWTYHPLRSGRDGCLEFQLINPKY